MKRIAELNSIFHIFQFIFIYFGKKELGNPGPEVPKTNYILMLNEYKMP